MENVLVQYQPQDKRNSFERGNILGMPEGFSIALQAHHL